MEQDRKELEFETDRLEETIAIANEQLLSARERNEETKMAIITAKQELRDNTVHSIGNLWGSEDFEALAELNQYMDPITSKVEDYESVERKIVQLEHMVQSPYFARIDFKFEDEEGYEKIYIGRSSLKSEKGNKFYIYDWRTPIASVFYRFVLGTAYYDAPGGRIFGDVSLKRQYEIKQGKLEYFFDANVQIIDEFLRKMLSQNTSPKMKTIVETIQKEQDIVIRDMEHDLMMVQGVAGSGKTSIALHRAAYLMYQGLSSKLTANNILIISPNTLFEQYISNVLPELGEEHAVSVVFEDIMSKVLRTGRVQSRNEFLDNLITNSGYRNIMKSSMEFKTSCGFLEVLNRLIEDIPHSFIVYTDVSYNGKCIISKEKLKQKVLSGSGETLLGARLKVIKDYTFELLKEAKQKRGLKPKRISVGEVLPGFLELDMEAVYRTLFSDRAYFSRLSEGVPLPDCMEDIFLYTQENLESRRLYFDDATVLTYLTLRINGNNRFQNMRHVVIDEAQDYYPLHFEIFKLMFPRSKFTILGDVNQTLEKRESLSLYEQIQQIFNKKRTLLATMNKSFRCTNEILNYSLHFLDEHADIRSFNRQGEEPKLHTAQEKQSFRKNVITEVKTCLEMGYRSVGLICKTERDAHSLYDSLKHNLEITLIRKDGATDLQGVFVMPVYMSKGLEFDAVLICDTDTVHYSSEDDKKLLYIACSRALHRLNLFCMGTPSSLLLF